MHQEWRGDDAPLAAGTGFEKGQASIMVFIVQWLLGSLGLAVADRIVPGIEIESAGMLVLASLVLGLVNATVRPVLMMLTLPLTVLTLGLFFLVINGLSFALAAALVPGFSVASLGSAIAGALIVTLVSFFLTWLIAGARAR
jgi:putative membrane protein